MKKNTFSGKVRKVLFFILMITLVFSIVYAIINMASAPSGHIPEVSGGRVKSDYALMLLQCMLGVAVMFLPSVLERRLNVEIPNYMEIIFFIFLYAAIYLGEVHSFYAHYENFDKILHIFSGIMYGALGFTIVNVLNENSSLTFDLSPFFIALFAFCFSMALGAVWEIYEYTADGMFSLNMQKHMLEDGTVLMGRAALQDTMEDIIVDAGGALAVAVFGYIQLKNPLKRKKSDKHTESEKKD